MKKKTQKHISTYDMFAYFSNILTKEEAMIIKNHLDVCEMCQEKSLKIKRLFNDKFNPEKIFPKNDFNILIKKMKKREVLSDIKIYNIKSYFLKHVFVYGIIFLIAFSFIIYSNYYIKGEHNNKVRITKIYNAKEVSFISGRKHNVLKTRSIVSTKNSAIQFQLSKNKIVLLGNNSSMYVKNSSEIILKKGYLYGRLIKDKKDKFIIKVGDFRANIIGTKFYISKSDDVINIYVYKGHIKVNNNNSSIDLLDGMRLHSSNNITTVFSNEIDNFFVSKVDLDVINTYGEDIILFDDFSKDRIYMNKTNSSNKKEILKEKKMKNIISKYKQKVIDNINNSNKTDIIDEIVFLKHWAIVRVENKEEDLIFIQYIMTNEKYGEIGIWIDKLENIYNKNKISLNFKVDIPDKQYFYVVIMDKFDYKWVSKPVNINKKGEWFNINLSLDRKKWEIFNENSINALRNKNENVINIKKIGIMIMGGGDKKWHSIFYKKK